MTVPALSPDTQAIALLVGRFGKGQVKPLTRGDYNRVAQLLHVRKLRPSDLFKDVPFDLPVEQSRVAELIGRGTALALAVERWGQFGINVVSRADPEYPARFKSLLKSGSAPILFYAGDLRLLETPTLGVVGSRDASVGGIRFASQLGERAATEDVVIASGDARGIDRAAMEAALDAGGRVIGILADSLAKSVLSKRYRQAIGDNRLLLISHVEPEAGFTVHQAMERNRYIYTASDAVVIADSDVNGGTWSGAIENEKQAWTAAYTRVGVDAKEGNVALLREGLATIGDDWFGTGENIRSLFRRGKPASDTLPLFSEQVAATESAATTRDRDELFELFLNLIPRALETPQDTSAIAKRFSVEQNQAAAWLKRAQDLGEITISVDEKWQRLVR
jgi:predicted Rossmann fold nucleotide-binding protein DprA/Smf involved in DNA uptake